MKDERYQFFELERIDPKRPRWMQQSFLDRVTQTVYLPVFDPHTQILAMMDDELAQVNGRPYCRLQLYVEQFPEMRAGLLDLEKQLIAEA